MKKILTVVGCIILGAIVSIPLYNLSTRVWWKLIDYFRFPVDKLLALKPFGKEFWVETPENEIYKITYPCLDRQSCWEKSEDIPSLTVGEYLDEESHEYIEYSIGDGKCDTSHNIAPLLGKNMVGCVTSVVRAESFYIVSLALTDTGELWIWDKPWVSPYTEMENIVSSLCLGTTMGLLVGIALASRNK